MSSQKTRHIIAVSGGKDSAALAIYMRDPNRWQKHLGKVNAKPREPLDEVEYIFCDTGAEIDETHEYLDRLEKYLGKPVVRLRAYSPTDKAPFDYYLELYGGFLPSPSVRWCTYYLRIKPFEDHIGDDRAVNYVGFRVDEKGYKGYISKEGNIISKFPFIEDGIDKSDIYRIVQDSGLGLPSFYDWRSRSGCYFCFFQRRSEWIGLKENHPDLFEKAKAYEKIDEDVAEGFTWIDGESLKELEQPERIQEIKHLAQKRAERLRRKKSTRSLMEVFLEDEERSSEDGGNGCNIVRLW